MIRNFIIIYKYIINIIKIFIFKIISLIKFTNTCPAIRLIDKRRIKVKGRIKKLNNSIKINIGAKIIDVPIGSK